MFSVAQIESLLDIVNYHFLFTISTNFGVKMLSKEDINSLLGFNVNLKELGRDIPNYTKMYLLGKLTAILSEEQVRTLDYPDLLQYFKKGQYIPLSRREQIELELAQRRSYVHLKGLKERAKQQFESIVLNQQSITRSEYETAVKEEIAEGVAKRRSLSAIVSELGHRTKEWQHDWGRIVDTEMNNIFQQGRAEVLREKEADPLVYKNVYPGACRHCIQKYLSAGIGSRPIVFKLSELEANGTNVGKKVADWKPTLGGLHPFCRCTLYHIPKGYVWDEERQLFDIPKDFVRKVERRSKITIRVGDKKEFQV